MSRSILIGLAMATAGVAPGFPAPAAAQDAPAAAQDAPDGARKLIPAVGDLGAHDANRVFLRVSNRGGIGLSLSQPDLGNFPRGTADRYFFGAGLWIGGIGDVNDDGAPDSLVTTGYNPDFPGRIEWIEGAVGFNRDEPRFRVLDSDEPGDESFFPTEPVADEELFTMYGDRFSLPFGNDFSIPLGVEVRQRSFAFDEPGLDGTIFFQWDLLNISDQIRPRGYAIEGLTAGIVLDPDIGLGDTGDDTAAPLEIDGRRVLVVWDANFFATTFDGTPGFLAIVPLEDPDGVVVTQMESGGGQDVAGVQEVPQDDAAQYRAMVGAEPNEPTIRDPDFDLRALISWEGGDLPAGAVRREAAAVVFAPATGQPPATLVPSDGLSQDDPVLAALVEAVRSARSAYGQRLANLPALLDFPGAPRDPTEGVGNAVFQNYPNPFRDRTTVEYNVVEDTRVRIEVLDLRGSLVTALVDQPARPGRHTTSWDGMSASGIEVPPGIYVVRMTTDSGDETSVRALKRP